MGANSSPSRVFNNKRLPGQYGHEQVTIQNLEIVKVDAARGVLLIKGAIPGPKGGVVCISDSVKA
jgi:large subunit ribosomal protein L3